MTKNQIKKEITTLGGHPHYSGTKKTMYVRGDKSIAATLRTKYPELTFKLRTNASN